MEKDLKQLLVGPVGLNCNRRWGYFPNASFWPLFHQVLFSGTHKHIQSRGRRELNPHYREFLTGDLPPLLARSTNRYATFSTDRCARLLRNNLPSRLVWREWSLEPEWHMEKAKELHNDFNEKPHFLSGSSIEADSQSWFAQVRWQT
jgi:hypothetical protein